MALGDHSTLDGQEKHHSRHSDRERRAMHVLARQRGKCQSTATPHFDPLEWADLWELCIVSR
jgi:hypothetical protein